MDDAKFGRMNVEWDDAQRAQMITEFWQQTKVRCPFDSAICQTNVTRFLVLPGYRLYVQCPECNAEAEISEEHDPLRKKFRSWTDSDFDKILKAHQGEQAAACPVCETRVRITESPTAAGTSLLFRCPRCSNHRTLVSQNTL